MKRKDEERAERLAAALRDNLRKRKAQARGNSVARAEAGAPGQSVTSGEEAPKEPGLRRQDD